MSGSGSKLKKRLLLNLDGTGQAEYTAEAKEYDGKRTSPPVSNVARIGRAMVTDDEQNGFEQGVGVTSNVRSAYGFICNNYDYGDQIYITGFSRGAFTARSVAGLIGRVGILTKTGLDLFYEAVLYYRTYYDVPADKRGPCPVSEEAGTTRIYVPNTSPKERIKIRAVGVWDTVGMSEIPLSVCCQQFVHSKRDEGALSSKIRDVKWRFHDVTLGGHIENAYHLMALNEHRFYFDVTLWESPEARRSTDNFEQCWMAGDHSNIGGSWQDQQMADISLAWMMSRFEALGVKFDQTYLYREFIKFKDYVKRIGPRLPSGEEQGGPYPANLIPRQWGEGRTHNIYNDLPFYKREAETGGSIERGVGNYRTPVWKITQNNDSNTWGGFLQNTNETFHPVIRYRCWCKRQGKLGSNEQGEYNPKHLQTNWKYPQAQNDGRIGQGTPTTSSGPLIYEYTRVDKTREKLVYSESVMGKHELLYLAFYDQDKEVQTGDTSIWKQVLGGDGPPENVLNDMNNIISLVKHPELPKPADKPSDPQIIKKNIYIGKQPAVADDVKFYTPYLVQGNDIKYGSWNGDGTLIANSRVDNYFAFTGLDRISMTGKIRNISGVYNSTQESVRSIITKYLDGALHTICTVAADRLAPSDYKDFSDSKITKFETKARVPKGRDNSRIIGLRLTTNEGTVWTLNPDYDDITDAQVVTEDAPFPGWELKGFYGAETLSYIGRLGPIWGH
ncbi:MAG: hypothetical protein Q9214_002520 [Letrouitia sp. 1 TL-2023]